MLRLTWILFGFCLAFAFDVYGQPLYRDHDYVKQMLAARRYDAVLVLVLPSELLTVNAFEEVKPQIVATRQFGHFPFSLASSELTQFTNVPNLAGSVSGITEFNSLTAETEFSQLSRFNSATFFQDYRRFPAFGLTRSNLDSLGMREGRTELGSFRKYANNTEASRLYSKYGDRPLSMDSSSIATLSRTAENKVMELGEMKGLKTEITQLDQYKNQASLAANEKAMKDMLEQQTLNHFAGQEKQLQSAMSQISKLKKKYASLNNLEEIPQKHPNPLHDKPLIERIVPGVTTQVIGKGQVMFDINPQVAYKFNVRLAAGAGWNERVGFSHHYINHVGRVYGPRSFAEFNLGKGFIGRGELEMMNTYVPTLNRTGVTDHHGRQWMSGVFVGLKKEYRLGKYLQGNIQTMYNLANHDYTASPYSDRLNIRIGFELPLKKKMLQPIKAVKLNSLVKFPGLDAAESKLQTMASAKQSEIKGKFLQYPSVKQTLTVSKGVYRKGKQARQMYLDAKQFSVRYNPKTKLNEFRDSEGKLLGTSPDMEDVTLPDGTVYVLFKVSKTECYYITKGKEVVRVRKNDTGDDIDVFWIDGAERPEILEVLGRLCVVSGGR